MGDRYHKAARDGYLGPLKEATRKDLNTTDEDGMTPTLWTAFHGHLEALQLICSRGGDPDTCDVWGNTCLHHAAMNGHLHILSFLVNFGANVWALDVSGRSALEAAAGKSRMDCVRLLDGAVLRETADNPRLAARRRERAGKECARRARDCERLQKKQQERMNRRLGRVEGAGVAGGDVPAPSLPGSGTLTLSLTALLHKRLGKAGSGRERPGGDVTFVGRAAGGSGEMLEGVGDRVPVSPDSLAVQGEDPEHRESLFRRPGLGNMLFRRNFGPGLGEEADDIGPQPQPGLLELGDSEEDQPVPHDQLPWEEQELGLDDEDVETTPLEVFLAAHNMSESLPPLAHEHIDLHSLLLCSDEDLRNIHLPLGPRKKILSAVERRKLTLETPCELVDTTL